LNGVLFVPFSRGTVGTNKIACNFLVKTGVIHVMRTKIILSGLTILFSVLQFSCSKQNKQIPQKPNILILFADDLGYEKVSCYGGLDVQTPNIDKLAAGGMLFENTFTSPVCTPSRMSFYMGEYTPRHKYTRVLPVHLGTEEKVDFNDRFTCYAKLLRDAGYQTSVTGKWQLATLEYHPNHIKSAGFNSWCVWQIWKDGVKTTRYWNPTFNRDGKILEVEENKFGSDVLTDYVVEKMESAKNDGQPFLIHHNIMLPHYPIIQTPDDKSQNREASLDNLIRYLDKQIGILTKALDDLELNENTYVFFLGDNGTESDVPRKTIQGEVTGGKHQLNHGGMHVPFIAYAPGKISAGTRVHDLIDFVDFFPTICELAGVQIPENANPDGIAFTSILNGTANGKRAFVTGGIRDDFCVFDGNWRLHHQNDVLVDCRELPMEKPANLNSAEARKAKEKLLPYLNELRKINQ
jgi:arylsulfatase A